MNNMQWFYQNDKQFRELIHSAMGWRGYQSIDVPWGMTEGFYEWLMAEHVETCKNLTPNDRPVVWTCSNCLYQAESYQFNYCPNCGARVCKEVDNADE